MQSEDKKSFWLVYTLVAIFYVAMAITFGLVVHHAAENGANDVAPMHADNDSSNEAATKTLPDLASKLYSLVAAASAEPVAPLQ